MFTSKLKDTHTAIALQAAIDLGAKNLFFVGYDGYQGGMSQMERSLALENEELFKSFKEKNEQIKLFSLTPTNYQELHMNSVYHMLIDLDLTE